MHNVSDKRSTMLLSNGQYLIRRKIDEFPHPFSYKCTPYENKNEFSSIVKRICKSFHYSLANVKPSQIERTRNSKIIILGDVCVGKTSLVKRFCHEEFYNNYKGTVGVDFEVQRFEILNVPFNLHIWDTAGQERFKSIAQSYYRAAQVIILVFDLTNLMTLTNCKKWLDDALNESRDDGYVFLVGTKKDLLAGGAYTNIERVAMSIAIDLKAEYWGVSARTGENVSDLFSRIAAIVFNDVIEAMHPPGDELNVSGFSRAKNLSIIAVRNPDPKRGAVRRRQMCSSSCSR